MKLVRITVPQNADEFEFKDEHSKSAPPTPSKPQTVSDHAGPKYPIACI